MRGSVDARAVRRSARASPPVALGSGASTSVVEVTSANSRGLAGPTLTSALSLPSVARHSPSSLAAMVARQTPGSPALSVSVRVAPDGEVSVTVATLSAMVWRCTDEVAAAHHAGAAPPPRGPAASSASARAGAAGRDAGRRPRSRAPTARCGRTAAARRGLRPRATARSSGLLSGALHDGGAGRVRGVDQAEPAAPVRRIGLRAFEPARHRMALAERRSDVRVERLSR